MILGPDALVIDPVIFPYSTYLGGNHAKAAIPPFPPPPPKRRWGGGRFRQTCNALGRWTEANRFPVVEMRFMR